MKVGMRNENKSLVKKEPRIWATKLKEEGTEERSVFWFVIFKEKGIHGDNMVPISFEENKKVNESVTHDIKVGLKEECTEWLF